MDDHDHHCVVADSVDRLGLCCQIMGGRSEIEFLPDCVAVLSHQSFTTAGAAAAVVLEHNVILDYLSGICYYYCDHHHHHHKGDPTLKWRLTWEFYT